MTLLQIIAAGAIHLFVPLLGVAAYVLLFRRACQENASRIFLIELFFIFFVYGGWLMVLLTSFFWQWSGMASLGAVFLLFGAPVVLIPVTAHLYKTRKLSILHRRTFQAAVAYFPLIILSFGAAYRLP